MDLSVIATTIGCQTLEWDQSAQHVRRVIHPPLRALGRLESMKQVFTDRLTLWRASVAASQDEKWVEAFCPILPDVDPETSALTETLWLMDGLPQPAKHYYTVPNRSLVRYAIRLYIYGCAPALGQRAAIRLDEGALMDRFDNALDWWFRLGPHYNDYERVEQEELEAYGQMFFESYKKTYLDQDRTPRYPLHSFFVVELLGRPVFAETIAIIIDEALGMARFTQERGEDL